MRRGVGIGGLQKQAAAAKSFQKTGSELQALEMGAMKEQLETFKTNLTDFAQKYKKDINKDPEFRRHFQVMCTSIGVDPLASNKGFWAELLGVGDFYYELGVQITDACIKTRPRNGGLIEIGDLRALLEKARGPAAQAISEDDIERAIKKLKCLGNGFNLLTVGRKKLVQSVPVEINIDHTIIMTAAQDNGGCVSEAMLRQEPYGWEPARIHEAFGLLLEESIAWVDDQGPKGQRLYWFPTLMQ